MTYKHTGSLMYGYAVWVLANSEHLLNIGCSSSKYRLVSTMGIIINSVSRNVMLSKND